MNTIHYAHGVPLIGSGAGRLTSGKQFFVNTVTGSDAYSGKSWDRPFKTLARAYALCTAGNGDTIYVAGNGQAAGSQRLSAAFTWAKDNTHLVGVSAPGRYSQRSRIAPTAAVAEFSPLFAISADACIFANLQWFHGFDTGSTAGICVDVTGERNYFDGCHIAGMGHATMADQAGSASLSLTGNGENTFHKCTIGLNTVPRSTTNAEIDLKSAAVRNYFDDCDIVTMADAATHLFVKADGSGDLDRETIFNRCRFINSVGSTATAMTAALSVHASAGGLLVLQDCMLVGATDWTAADNTNVYLYGAGAGLAAPIYTGIAHTVDVS